MQGMQGAAAFRRLSVNPLTCASNAQGAEGNCNAKKWRPFRAWSQKALISYGSTGRGAPPAHGYAESTGETGAPCSGAPCARGCVITTPSKHCVRKRVSPAYRYAESAVRSANHAAERCVQADVLPQCFQSTTCGNGCRLHAEMP